MKVHDVDVETIQNDTSNHLSDTFYRNCNFCNKIVHINPANLKSCLQLSGGSFYCPFCLRNNFHHKLSQNVLIMSYRGIIGYYYWDLYRGQERHGRSRMWYSDISTLIDRHQFVGLKSPVFFYDPSTYLWFVDFNRIGVGKKKAPISEVKDVAKQIMLSFDMSRHMFSYANDKMWDKYDQAIDLYFRQRKRPKDKRMLIPTLAGVSNFHKESFWEKTRSFTPASFSMQ